jgi:hypothetical protein
MPLYNPGQADCSQGRPPDRETPVLTPHNYGNRCDQTYRDGQSQNYREQHETDLKDSDGEG